MTQIKVKTLHLRGVLEAILPAVPNKPSRDILKCIKVTASQGKEDEILFQATDLERFLNIKLGANLVDGTTTKVIFTVDTPGKFAVPAQIFTDYVRAIEDEYTIISVTPENTVKLESATSQFEVGIMDIDDFPDFPDISDKLTWVEVEAEAFRFGLQRVLFAVAEKGHPKWGALSSIRLELDKNVLAMIGTDQHRASIANIEVANKNNNKKELLVSSSALEVISKIFEGTIQVSLDSPNALIFKNGNATMFVRLVSGNYPPVRNFIPNHPNTLSIDSRAFLKEIKKVSLATDKFAAIRLGLRKDKAIVTAKTREEKKAAKVEFAINNVGSDVDFTIDCRYLMDVLKVDNSVLELSYNKSNQPLKFKTEGFEHVIVPKETR